MFLWLSHILSFLYKYKWLCIIFVIVSLCVYIIVTHTFMKRKPIVVVFDLDETLGSFVQLGAIKSILEAYNRQKMTDEEFHKLIDTNQDFIRPGIIDILKYVTDKRKKGYCDSVMIYTNNQGPPEWAESIADYFTKRIGVRVFDKIIAAFKVNGRRVEPGRTSHDKSYSDFLRCTRLPPDTEVCFIDDVEHPHMEHGNVYYVNLKPYDHKPSLLHCATNYYNDENTVSKVMHYATRYYSQSTLNGKPKTEAEQEVDAVIGKYLLQRMYDFFNTHHRGGIIPFTRRKSIRIKRPHKRSTKIYKL